MAGNRTKQQSEALAFFNSTARNWRRKAAGELPGQVNIVEQRHSYVLSVLSARGGKQRLLDVGCGTGELVCDAAAAGFVASGIDFAPEMIALCEKLAQERKVSATFACTSVFDYAIPPHSLDVISANGFIEYISPDEFDRFLRLCAQWLVPGGAIILSSRNRLFNVFSLNAYTQQEIDAGTVTAMVSEALVLAQEPDALRTATTTVPVQPENYEHAFTGVHVRTRYQFTPLQLAAIVKEKGFVPREAYPFHIHALNPALKEQLPDVHVAIAMLLQQQAERSGFLLTASSFMFHATKP